MVFTSAIGVLAFPLRLASPIGTTTHLADASPYYCLVSPKRKRGRARIPRWRFGLRSLKISRMQYKHSTAANVGALSRRRAGASEIVASTIRVRSLRHTECADYFWVSYFLPPSPATTSRLRPRSVGPAALPWPPPTCRSRRRLLRLFPPGALSSPSLPRPASAGCTR